MRAAFIQKTGSPEVIEVGELPTPQAGPGQLLIKVGASALNPIDLYLRSGLIAMPMAFPYIIGCDFAGTVVESAPGSERFQVGDRVWGSNQGLLGRQGVTAELAAVDECWCYPTPANLSDQEAASIALVAITAHLGLFRTGRLQAGETVYVPGGSGGVGSMVVQIAKAAGAKVVTSAGSPDRVDYCRSLGADLALNYKTDDIPAQLRAFAPDGIDVWYETQREPQLDVSIPLLRKRGRIILMAGRAAQPTFSLGSFYPRDCSILGFAMFNATPEEQQQAADDINRWAQAGQLKANVGRVFPMAEASQAELFLEQNTVEKAGTLRGKVVIEIA